MPPDNRDNQGDSDNREPVRNNNDARARDADDRQGYNDDDHRRQCDDDEDRDMRAQREEAGDFRQANRQINIITSGPNVFRPKRHQKVLKREVNSVHTKLIKYLHWSETPISFSRDDHWVHLQTPANT